MRALVTGVAGFLGSHVARALVERGDEVWGIDDLSTGEKENVPPGVDFEVWDIRDGIEPADVIYHFAAFSRSGESYHRERECWSRNVDGTAKVLEVGCPVVFASSAAVHASWSNPYAASKARAEDMALEAESACLRYASVYGPQQSQRGDCPNVVASMLRDRKKGYVKVSGDGTQTRDFVHVDDAVAATLDAKPGIWDVATGVQTSMLDLAWMFGVPVKYGIARLNDPESLPQPGTIPGYVTLEEGIRGLL